MENEMTSGRLPQTALPHLYTLTLRVVPDEGQFSGREIIDIEIHQPVKAITLHALELVIEQACVHQKDQTLLAKVSEDHATETITFTFLQNINPGMAQIEIVYSGKLNQQLRGLYEASHNGQKFAFTQFEATDARRMFPCFDEPGMKARFSLTVTHPAHLTALSNMPLLTETVDNDGAFKTTRFDTTPVMSTYLLALALAPLQSKSVQVGRTTVTVWALPEQLALGEFALKVTAEVLPRLNDYFDMPYPYPKLDLVSAPNFAMGAMENWGAIFFRDSCLLLSETLSSTATQRDVANVITHEIVHQWFGNLVTMKWWDDLWLNESFATWLAVKIVDQWRPEWNSWVEFQQEKEIPLSMDALKNTRPIQSEVTSAAQIEELFDALTYEKGAACLRMIESFLGEDLFRKGIRQYMKKFAYQNASAEDLWEELTMASGQPVGEIARAWFTQPGYPLLTLRMNPNQERSFTIEQRRFSTLSESNSDQRWVIPFTYKYQDANGVHTNRILLKDPVTKCPLPGVLRPEGLSFLYGNVDEGGFFRTDYDDALRKNMEQGLPDILSPSERIGYLDHLWALSLSGRCSIALFLDTVCRFKGDTTRVVVVELAQYLETLSDQMVAPEQRSLFRAFVADLMTPVWKAFGWDAAPGENDEIRLARAAALWGLGSLAEDEDILAELPRRKTRYDAIPTSLDPTLATPLIRLCARFDGGSLFDPFAQKYQTASAPEERDRYLTALADFNKPALAIKLLEMTLSPVIRSQDVWKPVRSLLGCPRVQEVTWGFIKTHWKDLRDKTGSVGATRIIQSARVLWKPEWKEEIEQFFSAPPNKVDAAERALAQTVERVEIGIRFKAQQGERLREWLMAREKKTD
jgi:puromycin-sensitive aminopeptidase